MDAVFFEDDRDGRLDLFVSSYRVWDPRTEPLCSRKEDWIVQELRIEWLRPETRSR